MERHDLILIILALFSEAIGTLSGFGSSTFFVPLAAFFESAHLVLVLTAILHCFGNLFRLFIFRKSFQAILFLKLFIPSVVFTGIGALMTSWFSPEDFRTALGVFLMIMPILIWIFRRANFRLPIFATYFLTSLSGFATGLVGTGGAVRGLVLTSLQLEKNSFVMLSASIDFGGDLVRALVYLKNGFMDWSQWYYVPLLGLAAFFGARLGQLLLARLDQTRFEYLVSIFVFASGVALLMSHSA